MLRRSRIACMLHLRSTQFTWQTRFVALLSCTFFPYFGGAPAPPLFRRVPATRSSEFARYTRKRSPSIALRGCRKAYPRRGSQHQPVDTLSLAPLRPLPRFALGARRTAGFRGGGLPQAPNRPRQIELTGLRLRHHAVEIAARRRAEMLRRLGRDDGDRNRRLLAAHGLTCVAPEGFRDAELAAQPVGGIDDLRPGRGRGFQVSPQPRREVHQ